MPSVAMNSPIEWVTTSVVRVGRWLVLRLHRASKAVNRIEPQTNVETADEPRAAEAQSNQPPHATHEPRQRRCTRTCKKPGTRGARRIILAPWANDLPMQRSKEGCWIRTGQRSTQLFGCERRATIVSATGNRLGRHQSELSSGADCQPLRSPVAD